METARIAKTAVSAAVYSIDKPYDYLIPDALAEQARPGVRVVIPFGNGNRACEGIILAVGDGEKYQGLKAISEVLDPEPVLDGADISLALWMARRYFCTAYDAFRVILPAGLWYRTREIWRLLDSNKNNKNGTDQDAEDLNLLDLNNLNAENDKDNVKNAEDIENSEDISDKNIKKYSNKDNKTARAILEYIRERKGRAEWEKIKILFGEVRRILNKLEEAGILKHETESRRQGGDRVHKAIELALPSEDALALADMKRRRSPARLEVVRFLAVSSGRASWADVRYYTGADSAILRGMEKDGLIIITEENDADLDIDNNNLNNSPEEIVLNSEQENAYNKIYDLIEKKRAAAVLLRGVTGSGKTLIYLKLAEEVLKSGGNIMILVPEIILTPRMIREFRARFGADVVLLHSSLRVSERYAQWKRVKTGEARIVLGTRSAIFAPLRNLRLIVLDEEQEDSYQSEQPPRYHAREIAKYLCAREKAVLVSGSATPSIETAWQAEQGVFKKILIQERYNQKNLPKVIISDLKKELRSGNPGLIGAELRYELEENLKRGEQSILLLNRRGSNKMFLCGECGYIPVCPRCSAALTYHTANRRMMCHYCGYSQWEIESCPQCGGAMKHVGTGTQKVEAELNKIFPEAGVLRMDSDSASGRHEELLKKFEREKIAILLGTQMVAKGLDYENVTLAGVLLADQALYIDHYRAAERTFDLLTQVTGRAGRGDKPGRAVIQTYTPENDIIQSAAAQDYEKFYAIEIRMRELRRYPPFADLFRLTVSGLEEERVRKAAADIRDILLRRSADLDLLDANPEVLGPAPAPVLKINYRFQYRILLIAKDQRPVRNLLSWLLKNFAKDKANRGLYLSVFRNGT